MVVIVTTVVALVVEAEAILKVIVVLEIVNVLTAESIVDNSYILTRLF